MKRNLNFSKRLIIGFPVLFLLLVLSCERQHDENNTEVSNINILENATEFTGDFPDPVTLSYTYDGNTYKVKTFNAQFIIFFKTTIDETGAKKVIDAQQATILEKVPKIGYYLVELPPSQIQSFINNLDKNDSVDLVTPNTFGYLKSTTTILDLCGRDHGVAVQQTLESCGGSFDVCQDIAYVNPKSPDTVWTPLNKVIRKLLDAVNANKSGPTLINLSANGGLSGVDFSRLPADSQAIAMDSWFIFMQGVAMTIASLPEEIRKNVVVTVAAGNENMPLQGMLNTLRERMRMPEILQNNILIVSTARMLDPHANYALDDQDVVVMNNESADNGTSFAAPCALGMVQTVIEEKKVTAVEALALIKQASMNNPKREILWSDILPMSTYTTTSSTVDFGPYISQNGPYTCESMLYFNIQPTIYWKNDKGTLIVPTFFHREASGGAGCIMTGITEDTKTYQILLYGSNSEIKGTGIENILSGGVQDETGFCGFYNAMVFKGITNSDGSITGELQMILQLPFEGTMVILDSKTTSLTFSKQ
jgi:hypothetical protein